MKIVFPLQARKVGLECLALLWALAGAGLARSARLPALPGDASNPPAPTAPRSWPRSVVNGKTGAAAILNLSLR